jgi:hypothetical protein
MQGRVQNFQLSPPFHCVFRPASRQKQNLQVAQALNRAKQLLSWKIEQALKKHSLVELDRSEVRVVV